MFPQEIHEPSAQGAALDVRRKVDGVVDFVNKSSGALPRRKSEDAVEASLAQSYASLAQSLALGTAGDALGTVGDTLGTAGDTLYVLPIRIIQLPLAFPPPRPPCGICWNVCVLQRDPFGYLLHTTYLRLAPSRAALA